MTPAVNLNDNTITNGTVTLTVRPLHAEMLYVLVQSKHRVSLAELHEKVYGLHSEVSFKNFRDHNIPTVRRVLGELGYSLTVVYNQGYLIKPSEGYVPYIMAWSRDEETRLVECYNQNPSATEFAHMFPNRTVSGIHKKISVMAKQGRLTLACEGSRKQTVDRVRELARRCTRSQIAAILGVSRGKVSGICRRNDICTRRSSRS